MGADILYLSPCCKSEDWTDLDDGTCRCNECGDVFDENRLTEEVVIYDLNG